MDGASLPILCANPAQHPPDIRYIYSQNFYKMSPRSLYRAEVNPELRRGRKAKPSCSNFCQYSSQKPVDYWDVQSSTTFFQPRTLDSRAKAASTNLLQNDRQIGTLMANNWVAAIYLFVISSISFVAGSILRRTPARPMKFFGSWGQLGALCLALTLAVSTSSSILLCWGIFWGSPATPIILSGYFQQRVSYFLMFLMLCTSLIILHQLSFRPRLLGREDHVGSSDWTAQTGNIRLPPRIHSHSPT